MKRKLAIFLVLTLVFTLIYPAMGVILAEGGVGPDTTTIIVSNSKTVEDYGDAINVYEPDMHNVIGYYVHHVGYEYVDGLPTVTRTVLQFDLNSINPNRTIEKIELQYYQTHARPNSHMIIWGSNNYQWIERDQALPDKDVPIANELVDRTGEERISYDVSAYVMSQLAGEENDKKATFLFEGATDPSDPNAPGIERYTSFSSKEDSDAGKHPRLVITYGANTPPSGNIVVEGNGYTGSRAVQLNITAVDPEGDAIEMNIYEGSPSDNWVEYQSRKEWILSDGDGEKTIFMQLRDQHGSTSEVYSTKVTLDTVAPIARFTIYEGSREYTTTPLVTLQVSGEDEDDNPIESMRLSNQQGSWNNWIDFTESYPWTLEDASDGLKTVYLQLIDKAGNVSEPVSQAIILDQTAPEGSIAINNNATHTNTTAVELTLEGDDGDGIGRIQMRHSNDNQLWNQWGSFQEKLDWNLAEGDGQKTVYMELRDGAENESIVSASIYLDTTAPTGNVSINGGADYTNTEDVILTVEANDGDGIGSIEVQFSNDEQVWSEWIDFDSELENKVYVWQLAEGDGYKQVYIRLRDGLENESSSVIGSTIILDTIPPSISGVENGGLYNTEVKIEFNEGTATLNGSAFVSGATVSQEGSYELIVTDAAGNETKVQFTIDQTAPTGNLQINEEGSNYTNTLDVVLHFTGTDMGGSAFIETRFSNDLEEWKDDWEQLETDVEKNMPWTLKNDGNSEKVVYMQLRDEAGNVSTISATITYKSIPIPAEEHTVRGEEDQNLNVQKSDFNYENTDGTDIHSIKIVTLPEHGELTFGNEIVKSGQEILMSELEQYALIFTPEQDWYGSTELVWKAGNGFEFSDIAGKLLLELAPVNDAPVAKDIKLSSVAGETIVGQLEAYDIDNDLEDLRYKLVSEPTGGTLRIFDEESGAFEYVTNKGEHGTFTFTYQAFDGELFSNEATVEIEVRRLIIDPPPTPPIPEPPSTNPPVIPKEEEIPKEEANVKVEGASQQVLRIDTSQRNGLSVLHVGFNEKLFMEALDSGSNRLSLQIVDELDVIETELSEGQIEFLVQNSLDIELVTSGVTYLLPVQNIGFDSIINDWGLGQAEQDYKLRFRVTAATQATQDIINLEAQRQNFEVVHLPVSFNLLLVYDEKEYPIYKLDRIIPELVSWSVPEHPTSTAAVVVLSDGTIAPLPTKFNRSPGKASVSVSGMLFGDIALVQMNKSFNDMAGHWAKGAVENLASKLILNGRDNERFAPNDKVNRAEFTAILARGLGLWTEQAHADFADVKKEVWYDKPLQAVIEAGLVAGYDDQTFKPQQEITREEAAVIFARALKLLGKDVSLTEQEIESILIGFTDKESIKYWSREAIALSIRTGLISKDQQALLPNESLTRAQLAVMFDRLLRLL